MLTVHCALLAWAAARSSPTWDEIGHLVAGMSHWKFGRFDMYPVNPPLVRMVAALPMAIARPETDWPSYEDRPGVRGGMTVLQRHFVEANGQRLFFLLSLGRWACIPFSLIGALTCFAWARELYGRSAGLAAMCLWCFDPNILALGHMITPDAGAAALGVAAAYAFWRWLKEPGWLAALATGLALGLAELTKTTWILLLPLWPLLWVLWRLLVRKGTAEPGRKPSAPQLLVVLLLGVGVLHCGYGFEGSFTRLGDYPFISQALSGSAHPYGERPATANRFRETWLADLPVPLPKNYVMGIDFQKHDFEQRMWSYLRGQWRLGGWWYYYLYALAVKLPLGTWVLVFLAAGATLLDRRYSATPADELVLFAPVAVVLTVVSWHTGFNHHLRYVLPILPFAFIWMSKIARSVDLWHPRLAALAALALAGSIGSSLWTYPHSLSYFNELTGGPRHGPAHLLDSNMDWGQDLVYLIEWLDRHPEARPIGVAYFGSYDPREVGIDYVPVPESRPQPGWYAVSVGNTYSFDQRYAYFLRFAPVASAGYSIRIYHITDAED